ncbi:MAG: MFS transporter [Thermomicrobiales bacterium]|nr:MFS transporter [Thermomicrobiales bacterium]
MLFSLSSLGSEALIQSRAAWLLYFYAPPADSGLRQWLPLGFVGFLLTALRAIDSFDAILVGYWSDRTRSRLGRRLPFILAGAPLWALFAVLTFTPPPAGSFAATAVWFALAVELYGFFATLAGAPYEALMPEIARTSHERLQVVGARVYFGVAGAAIGLVGSAALVDRFDVQGMMIAVAALALFTRYLGVAGVWRRVDRQQGPADLPFRAAVRATFANDQFRAFLPTFVLFQTGLQMLTGLLPYYVRVVLGVDEPGQWVALLMAVAIVAMLAAVPVFSAIARRRSKREAYRLALLGTALAFPTLFFAGFLPGIPALPQVLAAMALVGAPMAGVYLFPAAITADVADHDASITGLRREASYFGAQNFVEKITSALSPLTLAGLLTLGNTAANPLGVRLVGPTAALFVLAGWFCFRSYHLPDDVLPTSGGDAGESPHLADGAPKLAREAPATTRPGRASRLRARLARRLMVLIACWGFRLRLEISGLEHVPPGEPLIVAGAPHRNWIDPFLIAMALPPTPRVVFLGSEQAMFGTWWKRVVLRVAGGVVPVSTTGRFNRNGLETSLAVLAAGSRLGVFPEGWGQVEAPPDEIQPVQRGVAFLSARSGRRVLPVGISGSQRLWQGKTLRVCFGPPLEPLAAPASRAETQRYAERLSAAMHAVMPPLPVEPPLAARRWQWLTRLL